MRRIHAAPYLLHLRPLSWPLVALHCLSGLVVAGAPLTTPETWLRALVVTVCWVVCLNGGTLALNSAFDRDQGAVGYLRRPPPVPPGLAGFAWALMLTGALPACFLGPSVAALYLACVALSWAYSSPPLRLKAVAGFDLLVNCLGYGALTYAAGWLAAARPLTPVFWWTVLAYGVLFAALYPLTQLYQMDADRARGDQTLVLRLGRNRALWLALTACLAAFALLALAWRQRGAAWTWLLWALALAAWLSILVPWLRRQHTYPEEQGMYRGFWAWMLTAAAVMAALR